jgi:hypothetical protein
LTELDAYNIFKGIRFHFTSSYDYTKYRGKFKEDKNFKRYAFIFRKLLKKHGDEFEAFVLSNILNNEKIWCTGLVSEEANNVFLEYKRVHESLSYVFEKDMNTLLDYCEKNSLTLDDLIEGSSPALLSLIHGEKIKLETAIILDMLVDYSSLWDKQLDEGDVLWDYHKNRMAKYKPFLSIDTEKFTSILRKIMISSA